MIARLSNGIEKAAVPNLGAVPRSPMQPPYLAHPPAVIPIDTGRQLFVDDFLIERCSLTRVFHRPTPHPANPLLQPRTQWEQGEVPFAMPFSDGVWFDPADQKFKMWYATNEMWSTALAVSEDGLNWERPSLDVVDRLSQDDRSRYAALVHSTKLEAFESAQWRRAADRMHVPFDEMLGVHPQDSSFLDKPDWDFENTPSENYPLLLSYHPLVLYRHQVIKQADVVLAMFLLGHEFSEDIKRKNFDYYNPLTTGDSSLSVCIESIAAWELGYREKAIEYLRYTALMDLANVGGNVRDGVHVASLAGSWMAIVYGLAGMRDHHGQLSFEPNGTLDATVNFPLNVRGQELQVTIKGQEVTYLLRKGSGLEIEHRGEMIQLQPDTPVVRSANAENRNELESA